MIYKNCGGFPCKKVNTTPSKQRWTVIYVLVAALQRQKTKTKKEQIWLVLYEGIMFASSHFVWTLCTKASSCSGMFQIPVFHSW